MQPLLELKSISKNFGTTQVLKSVDFKIFPGEIVALLGDNGAGKSTLVKIISGVETQTEGEIFWNQKPISWDLETGPKQSRALGIETVYQDLGFIDTLSITRNFFLGREVKKKWMGIPFLDFKKMDQIVSTSLKEAGVGKNLNPSANIKLLSGGEKQAIAISRAKHFGAKLLILDEPTNALSLRQTGQVLKFITQAAESGIAVIFITHTLAHLEGLIDRMVILHHGKNVGDYTPEEISTEKRNELILSGTESFIS